jgi:FixJ family two-component response regulator
MGSSSRVELARQATAGHPYLRLLFMSGYSARRDPLMQEVSFLEKPFTKRSLLAKVYSVLHSQSSKQQYHLVRATVFKP